MIQSQLASWISRRGAVPVCAARARPLVNAWAFPTDTSSSAARERSIAWRALVAAKRFGLVGLMNGLPTKFASVSIQYPPNPNFTAKITYDTTHVYLNLSFTNP
jgi:hypothetical protein